MKLRVGDLVEYVSEDPSKLKGSIGIVRSRSAMVVTVDWVSQSSLVHPHYDIRIPRAYYWERKRCYTFEDKHFSRITNLKEATWQAELPSNEHRDNEPKINGFVACPQNHD